MTTTADLQEECQFDSEEDITHIYALLDPRTEAIRYVGQTTRPEHRLKEHTRRFIRRGAREINRWISDLKAQGLEPRLEVLSSVASAEADAEERRWMSRLHDEGNSLLNRVCAPGQKRKRGPGCLPVVALLYGVDPDLIDCPEQCAKALCSIWSEQRLGYQDIFGRCRVSKNLVDQILELGGYEERKVWAVVKKASA